MTYDMGGVLLSRGWKFYNGYGVLPDALFHLKEDPMEQTDLISSYPKMANRMRKEHEVWLTLTNPKKRISLLRKTRKCAKRETLGF
ncbi:hypothetical protein ACWPKO_11050 [Coraliomargarita sp. W4R53]